jgi:hypothetical protein
MFWTTRIIIWVSLLFFNIYASLPTYIVQTTVDGSGLIQPHRAYGSILANRTSRLPGTEEMDGDFHHHDVQGNDLIRVVKKSAIIRACSNLKPLFSIHILPLPSCSNTCQLLVHARHLTIDADLKQRVNDGFLRHKTGHSPPALFS